jgi:photosystem II stability/assembly factor-like uncharacterized protein
LLVGAAVFSMFVLAVARRPAPGSSAAFDAPDAAQIFFLEQRLVPGADRLPLQHLHDEREKLLAREGGARAESTGSLPWVSVGPGNIGGRSRALVIDPTDPDTMYGAGVAGGVWKTTDGGASWRPLDDLMLNLAVCALAIDPTDPDVIYAGTGEGYYPIDQFVPGLGIFRSGDGGESWAQLEGTVTGVPEGAFRYVNEILISPNDPLRVYAGTQTGVWRSLDGGNTWEVILANPEYLASTPATNGSLVGCTDMAIRSDRDPDVIFASFGSAQADGLFISHDGGETWAERGLSSHQGRTTIALAPSDNDVVYLLMADNGSTNSFGKLVDVFRSVDGGETFAGRVNMSSLTGPWLLSNLDLALGCRLGLTYHQGWHDNVIAVDPLDPEIVWVGGVDLFRSDDGGRNFRLAAYWQFYLDDPPGPNYVHADQHVIRFHPGYDGVTNRTMFVGNDGGFYRTENARADTGIENCPLTPDEPFPEIAWESLNNSYSVTQFYHGDSATDRAMYLGGAQDNGSNRLLPHQGPEEWVMVFGGDGGYAAIDSSDSETVYVTYNGFPTIQKSIDGGETFEPATSGITDGDGVFIAPLAMDQSDPQVLWTGGSRPWRTTDGAALWEEAGQPFPLGGRITALAISSTDSNLVFAGLSNGLVSRTVDGLGPDPAWSTSTTGHVLGAWVSSVAADPLDPNVAYYTYSNYGVEHVHQSLDGGATWQSIDGIGFEGVPDIPAHWIEVRPCDSQELFVGTELGVFRSVDRGATWHPFNEGLAHTVVESLDFPDEDTLVAFTYGRGAFRRQLTPCGVLEPGSLPDGSAVPGELMTAVEAGAEVTLAWDTSCAAGGGDFAVYEGMLGEFAGHLPETCSTGGDRTLTFTPEAGSRYFLVTARNGDAEGSYGRASSGDERPASASPCVPQVLGGCP